MDAAITTDERGLSADGEVVWSRRPDAGVKFLRDAISRENDGGKKARSPGSNCVVDVGLW